MKCCQAESFFFPKPGQGKSWRSSVPPGREHSSPFRKHPGARGGVLHPGSPGTVRPRAPMGPGSCSTTPGGAVAGSASSEGTRVPSPCHTARPPPRTADPQQPLRCAAEKRLTALPSAAAAWSRAPSSSGTWPR